MDQEQVNEAGHAITPECLSNGVCDEVLADVSGSAVRNRASARHLIGVLSDRSVMEYVAAQGYIDCLAPRGGVIAMRPLLLHSSSKTRGSEPRRVLHIEYADALEIDDGMRVAVV